MNIWNLIETMIDFITSFKGFNKSKSVEKVNINENVDTDEKEEEMPAKLNLNAQWTDVKSAYANVNGEWKEIKEGYANDNGTWKKVYSSSSTYGIIYDKSLASDPSGCLTYTGLCNEFTPMLGTSGVVNEGSWALGNGTLFDNIDVGYFVNMQNWTSLNKSSMSDVKNDVTYTYFTKIPKIYQKVTNIDENKVKLELSLEPFNGATLHPSFVVDGVEKDYVYIGDYYGNRITGDKLNSQYQVNPITLNLTTARTYAKNVGSDFHVMSYYDWDLIMKLYILAFKNFDGRTVLGNGANHNNHVLGVPWIDGTRNVIFLGICNVWGYDSRSFMLDDTYVSAHNIYAGQNSNPTTDANNKIQIGDFVGHGINIYPMTCDATLNGFFIGSDNSGSITTGLCSKQFTGGNGPLVVSLRSGKNDTTGNPFGLSQFGGPESTGFVRLTYKP